MQDLRTKADESLCSRFKEWSKNGLQALLAEVQEPFIALQRAAKTLDHLRFKDALQHLLAEVGEPGTALSESSRRDCAQLMDSLEYLPTYGELATARYSESRRRYRVQFKDTLEYLLAEVDKPVPTLQRALKSPDLLRFYDGHLYKPNSQGKRSVTGDTKRHEVLKRGLSGTIDGLKVSALADTGAAQNVVSRNFARARKLDVAGSPSSFMQGNSKLAHSLGTSKNPLDNLTK